MYVLKNVFSDHVFFSFQLPLMQVLADGKLPPVQLSCASLGKLLFWWQHEVGCHPRPDPVPSPASLDGHLPERMVEQLEALGLALGWHHKHQTFLLELELIFPPWS